MFPKKAEWYNVMVSVLYIGVFGGGGGLTRPQAGQKYVNPWAKLAYWSKNLHKFAYLA